MSNRYLYLHVSLLHHALSFDCWLKHRCDREQTRHSRVQRDCTATAHYPRTSLPHVGIYSYSRILHPLEPVDELGLEGPGQQRHPGAVVLAGELPLHTRQEVEAVHQVGEEEVQLHLNSVL